MPGPSEITMLQLGARMSIQLASHQAPRGGPTFFDEKSLENRILQQRTDVGNASSAKKLYITSECRAQIPAEGEVPAGSQGDHTKFFRGRGRSLDNGSRGYVQGLRSIWDFGTSATF
uniref:Uncharacterized protein n=1 Tax=Eutreptiella gymnastica TaxID=73025 RepID=A0A7S4L9U4_9EUGL